MIDLAENLSLDPVQAATQRYAWIATSGGGKTYGEGRFVEQLHAANVPVIVVDTVGVWAPLRLAADGKSPGLPFVVIGGNHADLPLDLQRGAELAAFLVRNNASVVIDLSDETSKGRAPFVTTFCEGLLLALKGARRPRMVVFDEAQDIAPQKSRRWEQDMVESVSALIRKARNHLCGVTLLTQRPQSVSKEVLDLASNVFVGQLHGKAARKAVGDWCNYNTVSSKVTDDLARLPSLQPGQFFFWSPSWLKRFELVTVLPKWTFDGSSTIRIDPSLQLAELAPVDLGALRQLLAPDATTEEEPAPESGDNERAGLGPEPDDFGADDDREQAIDELQRRLDDSEAERDRVALQLDRYEVSFSKLEDAIGNISRQVDEAQQLLDQLGREAQTTPAPRAAVQEPASALDRYQGGCEKHKLPAVAARQADHLERTARMASAAARIVSTGRDTGSKLEKADKAILSVLAWQTGPIPKKRLALLAKYSGSGGGFNNALGRLRKAERITGSGELAITRKGHAVVGRVPAPPTGAALFAWWCEHPRVDGCMRAILQALQVAPARGLLKDELARRAGLLSGQARPYAANAGGFNNALGRLRTLGLVQGRGQTPIALAPELRMVLGRTQAALRAGSG